MAQAEYILEMNHITKEFPGVRALDDVSIKIKKGTVHALLGENGAGKSTLMKCLFGIYKPDKGEIILDGQRVSINSPIDAINYKISMIHQELQPVPQRNVMENIWLGRFPHINAGPFKFVDHKKMFSDTKELLERLEIDIDPRSLVGQLSVSKIQLIEIAKAVSFNSKVIVMDEPTSSLTENEVEHLFRIIRDLKSKCVSIIYISHKLEEIFEIADEVTIMRDGKVVGTWDIDELTPDMMIANMVGRQMSDRFPSKTNTPSDVILRVENLTSIHPKSFRNVSFDLRKGEILGVGGLVGAQRTELIEAIFGLRAIKEGKIYIKDKEVNIKSPQDAIKNKIALLTEDRKLTGIIPELSIVENATLASLRKYLNLVRLLNDKRRINDTQEYINILKIKTPSYKTQIKNLSGGNQQKVLIARWLLTEPEILLLDEPTRGIDVGAKFEIYNLINQLATEGKSIIMISSEMPELLGMSDRIMVMCDGRVSGILDRDRASEEEIMRLATRFSD